MLPPSANGSRPSARAAARCPGCGAGIDADQRYCLACGTRLLPVRSEVRAAIDSWRETTSAAPPSAGTLAVRADDDDAYLTPVPVPAPWQSAAAVLAVLAFGVFAGGVANPSLSFAVVPQQPTITAAAPAATTPTDATADTSTSDDSGDTAADTTVAEAPAEDPTATQTAADDGGDGAGETPAATTPSAPASTTPAIKHVFLVVLSGQGYDAAFGPNSAAPYLATELPKQGELLQNYYATTTSPLGNGIALISGQGPTPEILTNCPTFTDVAPGTPGADANAGQTIGTGCVFPTSTRTIGDQLKDAGDTWKAYIGGLGTTTCRHPTVGAADDATGTTPDGYATWRNPFAYFHSAIDDAKGCADEIVDLGQLDKDLADASTAPSLAYIAPDQCHDGNPTPCTPGAPAGLVATDAYLRTLIPAIQKSAAYNDDGLIAITFDNAPQTGDGADSSGCCTMPVYPNVPAPATPAPTTPGLGPTDSGGGQVGLLLISKFVEAGSTNTINSYNHFSLLRSLEDVFGLDHIGYAAMPTLLPFDKSVWNATVSGD